MKQWISFRAPTELARQLRSDAKDRGTTLTAVIVERLSGVDTSGAKPPHTGSEVSEAPLACEHPKARQRPVVGGKLCLECKRVLS